MKPSPSFALLLGHVPLLGHFLYENRQLIHMSTHPKPRSLIIHIPPFETPQFFFKLEKVALNQSNWLLSLIFSFLLSFRPVLLEQRVGWHPPPNQG